jgi:mannitol-1-/sugar-/sorbitol-6-/2-deoxyglucose-6-phosphatase
MRRDGRAKDGVSEILDYFTGRGYRIGLASNSPDTLIEIATVKLGIERYFAATASSVHERRGKPDPAVYLTAAATLETPPACCLAFEDSVAGLLAARGAGMITVAVPPPERFADPDFDAADLKLASLAEFTAEHEAALLAACRS